MRPRFLGLVGRVTSQESSWGPLPALEPNEDPGATGVRSQEGVEFSRQEYGSGLPFARNLPNPGIEPRSPTLRAYSLLSEPPGIAIVPLP